MINLMPPDSKKSIKYSRLNERLLKWTIGCLIITAAMAAVVVLGGIYIDQTKNNLVKSINSTKKTISDQNLDKTGSEAETLSSGIKLVVQVLSKEVLFSKLLQEIGRLMPSGATLGNVQLSNSVSGAVDLTANAVDYQSATQVQLNLQDPSNNLFDKVDTQSVSCSDATQSSSSSVDSKYKCQIVIRALFKSDASVTFLAGKGGSN